MKFHKSHTISLTVLIPSLIITFIVWQDTRNLIEEKKEVLFTDETREIDHLIKFRLDDYITTLYGLQSLFAGKQEVDREVWQRYCENLYVHRRIPAIHSLSFSPYVTESQKSDFVKKVRSDKTISGGFPDFHIFAAPDRGKTMSRGQQEHYVIDYLWPQQKDRTLHGLDEFSDSTRRALIERARDTGKPAASSRIKLFSDNGISGTSLIVYLPVYKFGRALSTLEDRRSQILGVITVVFKVNELMEEILSRVRHAKIDIEIFDGKDLSGHNLYYNDDDVLNAGRSNIKHLFSKRSHLDVYGQPWTIFFSTKSGFGLNKTEENLPLYVLGVGIVFSILLASTVFALTNSRIRALQLAERMTEDLEKQRALSMRSDRLRSLGQMAAGIAHELNQPLVGVRGLAEHVLIGKQRGWKFDEQTIREKISLIVEQADRMSHIIEHVRIFAREAGKAELRAVDVNEVVESSIDLLHAQFSSHGLILDKELAGGLPAVLANPFSFEEVLLNLIINGRDAVEDRLEKEPEMKSPGVVLRTREANESGQRSVRIDVTDNGVGIAGDIQEKIFDPFFTTKAPDKGTGLGLAISKSIVEEFGGSFYIDSVPGEGTTISIILPANSDLKEDG